MQGIFVDAKYPISTRIINNTFNLTQTNFIVNVRPTVCINDFDHSKIEFTVSDNIFNSTPIVTVTGNLFFYKGFTNVTYRNNKVLNIVSQGYSHFSAWYHNCPLIKYTFNFQFLAVNNYWDMSIG